MIDDANDIPAEVSQQQVGELLWDFCKKISKSLYDSIMRELMKAGVVLTPVEYVRMERAVIILDLWCISRAMISNDEILEYMHQKFLRVCGSYFGEYADDRTVWSVTKNELTERYGEYYSHWGGNEITADQIRSLAGAMARRMMPEERRDVAEDLMMPVVAHLNDVLTALLQIKREYPLFQ